MQNNYQKLSKSTKPRFKYELRAQTRLSFVNNNRLKQIVCQEYPLGKRPCTYSKYFKRENTGSNSAESAYRSFQIAICAKCNYYSIHYIICPLNKRALDSELVSPHFVRLDCA